MPLPPPPAPPRRLPTSPLTPETIFHPLTLEAKLSSKNRSSERTVLNRARLTGTSWISLLCDSDKVWVGWTSEAVLKSRSSRLMKSLSVRGAESVVDVRIMMESCRGYEFGLRVQSLVPCLFTDVASGS
ncbi:hypothetical protein KCU85_g220, partial [Aureobasidium melanogenum]